MRRQKIRPVSVLSDRDLDSEINVCLGQLRNRWDLNLTMRQTDFLIERLDDCFQERRLRGEQLRLV